MFTKNEIQSMKEFQIKNVFRNIDCSIFNKKMYFYYDETNNSLSFGLNKNNDNFNDNPLSDFIVGGIVSKNKKELNYENYRKRLGLQKNCTEMKSKNIFKGSFFDCLKSERIGTFLDIIEENNLYFHFSDLNKLFYSVADIVALIRVYNVREDYYSLVPGMIAILYECIKLDVNTFINIAVKFNFPNVLKEHIKRFYSEIENILVKNNSKAMENLKSSFNNDSYKLYFGFLFSVVHMVSEGVFTAEFDQGKMIESFSIQYYQLLFLYNQSKHQFDNIEQVKQELENNFPSESCIDYEFKDSKSSFMIQLSDVFVSIIGKAVIYTNSVDEVSLLEDLSKLNKTQKINLAKLNKLLNKSIDLHPSMCQYVTSLPESNKLSRLLFGDVGEKELKGYSLYL